MKFLLLSYCDLNWQLQKGTELITVQQSRAGKHNKNIPGEPEKSSHC